MGELVRKVPLSGFDPDGEPEIRVLRDGSLSVVFNFMPPSFVADDQRDQLGSFAHFDKELEAAVGVPVLWEDREVFLIRTPKEDTIERIQHFLEHYRVKQTSHFLVPGEHIRGCWVVDRLLGKS